MVFQWNYSSGTSYNVGAVVIYTDNKVYHLHTPAPAGTDCHNTRYWERISGELEEAVLMMANAINLAVNKAGTNLSDKVVNNLTTESSGKILDARQGKAMKDLFDGLRPDAKTLVLASSTDSSEKIFSITVDDTGELTVTDITPEPVAEEGT